MDFMEYLQNFYLAIVAQQSEIMHSQNFITKITFLGQIQQTTNI